MVQLTKLMNMFSRSSRILEKKSFDTLKNVNNTPLIIKKEKKVLNKYMTSLHDRINNTEHNNIKNSKNGYPLL